MEEKLKRIFGRYAIRNLSLVLILCYAVGYVLQFAAGGVLDYITLDPWSILHGQIWRIISWILIPPESSNIFFILIMLFFYYSIGTTLERTWGTWRYNVYIFSGILFTVVGAFVFMGTAYLLDRNMIDSVGAEYYFRIYAHLFSTFYVNMSIFLAYAVTFPDMQVLFMFFIPLKVKYLGILYAVMVLVEFLQGNYAVKIVILASLLNFFLLWIRSRKWSRLDSREMHRKSEFKRSMNEGVKMRSSVHRCAVCGRTEKDSPDLEFRYCSRCVGNFEYCQDHIFNHTHVGTPVTTVEGTVVEEKPDDDLYKD